MNPLLVLGAASVVGLAFRLVLSLGVVLAVIAVLVWIAKTRAGSLRLGIAHAGSPLSIRGRVQLTRTSTVALIEVGEQALLVAAWEQGVEVLARGADLLPPPPEDNEGSGDDRTSSRSGLDRPDTARTTLIEALREWSVRRR